METLTVNQMLGILMDLPVTALVYSSDGDELDNILRHPLNVEILGHKDWPSEATSPAGWRAPDPSNSLTVGHLIDRLRYCAGHLPVVMSNDSSDTIFIKNITMGNRTVCLELGRHY